jgi:hypothetical protein
MDLSSMDFQNVRIKHILFKSKVRSALYGGNIDETIFSSRQSPVGEWIYTKGIPKYGHSTEMQLLEKAHQEVHHYAHDLVSLYKRGKIEEAREGLSYIEKHSEIFLSLLDQIEKKSNSGSITGF